MRITVDIRLLARGGISGIEEYTRYLLGAILAVDRDNEYSLFYNSFNKIPLVSQLPITNPDVRSELRSPRRSCQLRVIDWKIPNKLFDATSRFFRWPKIDRFLKTDLVFSPHFNILAVDKAPRVITFHDLSFIHHPYFFSWRQKFWHWLQNIRRQAQEADKIIAVSQFTKNDLINTFGIRPEKIEVIYSGISEEFRPVDSIPIRPSYILYLGTLEPRKNVPAVIRAFNILKQNKNHADLKLVLAGRAGWLYGTIIKEAGRSPFRNDIIFSGAVRSKDRVKLYSGASVFVYPSFFEGFGFPPLEAQASGCPVVVSRRSSLPEILNDSAMFADPWRVEELAGSIDLLLSNDGLREKFIKAGLENVRRFTWQKSAEQTLKMFKSLHG